MRLESDVASPEQLIVADTLMGGQTLSTLRRTYFGVMLCS